MNGFLHKPYHLLFRLAGALALIASVGGLPAPWPALAQADVPTPPAEPVKLIFIHHSTGENWLADGYGDLGLALAQNNYFVSDTNYGWGPDSIGDRTDIPNWPEWFASENTPRFMDALFNESEQHSGYTRTFDDPGGENQIVMFKSCFPNSALEGNPTDPPDPDGWLSVGHAKYVYNEILAYFATRPDKLFVVITAPPLSDSTYAENARAFNNWLLNDWLRENDYPLNNVAVFDFYNVLTGPDAHHRFANGQVEHIRGTRNTLYYPSGDDHPSQEGSRKATEEFVPLLNVFYHRWKADAPAQPPGQAETPASPTEAPALLEPTATFATAHPPDVPLLHTGIDDFEAGPPPGSAGWEAFWDNSTPTTITCAPDATAAHSGAQALHISFDITANSWATCALFFDAPQDWSAARGLSFYLRAGQPGWSFNVDVYAGAPEARETYIFPVEAAPESATNWAFAGPAWHQFLRANWEADAGTPFDRAERVSGLAFGFAAGPDAPLAGELWIDDLQWVSGEIALPVEASPVVELPLPLPETTIQASATPLPTSQPTAPTAERSQPGSRVCPSSILAPLAAVALAAWLGKRKPNP
jgi:hypothetical protein